MRLIKGWGSNYVPVTRDILFLRGRIDVGKLYFVNDSFYERFKNCGLLENKETINGQEHRRPCCYLFKIKEDNEDIYWLIPISSQVSKYQKEYQRSIDKYGICDNISFGYILGEKRAFLPQNLFPVTSQYIDNIYVDKNTLSPITIPNKLMAELNAKARKKIKYNKQGKPFGMSKPMEIYEELMKDLLIVNN